jgi:hypothetical protein
MEERLKPIRKPPLAMLANAELAMEKITVMAKVRLRHLERRGNTCPDTEELLRRVKPIDDWLVERMASYLESNPAYWWFSHIKGIGGENIAKIIGGIEGFGRYYDVGDPIIPPYVKREPEEYITLDEGSNEIVKTGTWVEGIERLLTPSKQRVLIGHAPGLKRRRGERHSYDATLKMLFHRLGTSLMRAKGAFYEFYLGYRDYLENRVTSEGKKIIPTPRARYCAKCDKEVIKKAAKFCPDCGEPLSQKTEPPGVIYEGHIHMMAQRKMEQLFSDLLNVVWRQGLGLPVREPYPVERLGHSGIIRPEDMMDKSCGRKDCPICHGKDFSQPIGET